MLRDEVQYVLRRNMRQRIHFVVQELNAVQDCECVAAVYTNNMRSVRRPMIRV